MAAGAAEARIKIRPAHSTEILADRLRNLLPVTAVADNILHVHYQVLMVRA